jgi:hypothetical protein
MMVILTHRRPVRAASVMVGAVSVFKYRYAKTGKMMML